MVFKIYIYILLDILDNRNHVYTRRLDQSWATVYAAGPTLIQHWVNICCVVGEL